MSNVYPSHQPQAKPPHDSAHLNNSVFGPFRKPPLPRLGASVPDGFLDLVYTCDRKRVLRFEAGLALDPPLRILARISGAVDRALARRLHRMRAIRGYKKLGHMRFADYVHERLDLKVRTAQEIVRLGEGLERLPLLDEALKEGRLTWTAALQVARIAGVEDEAEWVELAQRCTVRELKEKVAAARKGARPDGRAKASSTNEGPDAAAAGAAPDQEASDPADDPLVRLRVRVTGATARMWEAAVELCEMMAGSHLAPGEAAEYILADFLSGADPVDRDSWPSGRSYAPVVGKRYRPPAADRSLNPFGYEWTPATELGSAIVSVTNELARKLELIDAPLPDDVFELDESMRALVVARRSLDLDLARLLRNFNSLGLARHIGYASFGEYVEARLGMSASRARSLMRLDYKLFFFPAIDRAVREGKIGTVAAELLCRVATPETTENEWIERARRRSVAALRKEVEWARREVLKSGEGLVLPPSSWPLPSALEAVTAQLGYGEQTFAPLRSTPQDCVPVEFLLRASAVELWDEANRRIPALGSSFRARDHVVLHEVALAFLLTHLPAWIDVVQNGDPVAVRDRFQCQAPGCGCRSGSGHHLRYRSQLGPDEMWNLVFLCLMHHLDGVHRGRMRISGVAPQGLFYELGLRSDGTPTERFCGVERVFPGERIELSPIVFDQVPFDDLPDLFRRVEPILERTA